MKGSDRNKKCPCGSGKKWKKCCEKLDFYEKKLPMHKNESMSEEVIEYFDNIWKDSEYLKGLGICQGYQRVISRNREGYLISLDKAVFKIKSDESLSFYEIIGIIAMETFGSAWFEDESKKNPEDRSEIFKIIGVLGAAGTFKKIISYTGDKIGKIPVSDSGFSKNFITLAFDIFCLRHQGVLPENLIERLKNFNEYQGARYEIAVAAIFCRLGYEIKWFDFKKERKRRPEFIAVKGSEEIYVEAKSRQIDGVHNRRGSFNKAKSVKSRGWGRLVNKALEKEVPPAIPYIIFIDMNAVNDGQMPPGWLEDIRGTLKKQHLKEFSGKGAPFTSIMFTNYSYHYQGLESAEKGICFSYENDKTERPYCSIQEKENILSAIKHYGFVPDYYIPNPMTILQSQSEYPRINNIPKR